MSDLTFGLIMYLVMLPVLIVMCVMLTNETKPKKNIILGVTVPFSAQSDPAVEELCGRFVRRLRIATLIMALLGVPMLLLPWFSVQLTVFLVWMLVVISVPYVLYVRAHLRLKALKTERRWYPRRDASRETVVDMSVAAAPQRRLSAWLFLPPLAVSLVPAVFELIGGSGAERTGWLILSLSFAFTVLLGAVLYPIIFRLRTDVAGGDADVNAALTNVRRAAWARAWIYIAWTTALVSPAAWLLKSSELGQLAVIIAYILALMALCLVTELGLRKSQEKLTAAGTDDYIDEDEHWPLGMFYYNENDAHLTVNDRVGMNMTINLAKPLGKILMGITALIIVLMPLVGVWVMGVEFSPTRAEAGAESVEIIHLTRQFAIAYDDVTALELISELPETARVNGTGLDTLCLGKFDVEGYGLCRVCLDPTAGPYIVAHAGGGTYIFSLDTPEATENLYIYLGSEANA